MKEKSEELNVDIAYIPKSGKKIIAKHGQGFSYPIGFYYVNQGKSAKVTYWPFNRTVMNGYNRQTTSVVQVNEGQITNYPFKIPKNFTVADTHAQYYQLDLNEDADLDGESDIAVWYTLTGTSTYDCSPKDVRNNYFIYTKGNVTYSGVGHSSLEGDGIQNEYLLPF